jgi:hypothetical protein
MVARNHPGDPGLVTKESVGNFAYQRLGFAAFN